MALSNWDTLAFDSHGNPSNGDVNLLGYDVSIYKNYLHIKTPEGAKIDVNSGDFDCGWLSVLATRDDYQSSVFVLVKLTKYAFEDCQDREDQYFCGIGCYGFWDTIEWLKVKHPEEFAKLNLDPKYLTNQYYYIEGSRGINTSWISFYRETPDRLDHNNPDDHLEVELPLSPSYEDGESWRGVAPETVEAFNKWLKKVAPQEYFNKIQWNDALRYNQGDAFFAQHAGSDIPATKVGEQQPTIMSQLI